MSQNKEFITYSEIITQTDAWREAIEITESKAKEIEKINLNAYSQIIFIGCGSTYYLSMAAAAYFRSMTGRMALALPSSELLFPDNGLSGGINLLVAISRSGTTSETLNVVENFKKNKLGDVFVVTNYEESPLAKLADLCISIGAGQEKSVVQTRSFASMFVALTSFINLLSSKEILADYKTKLINTGNLLIDKFDSMAKSLADEHSINQVFYLGSGPRNGLANELCLKLKEMSQTVTEAYHFFEFRHGPISLVNSGTLVIGLMSEKAFEQEKAVMNEVAKLGAKTLLIGEKGTDIEFNSELPEGIRNVLFLPVMQLFGFYRALSFGKNPDSPRNITAVVTLDTDNLVIE